MSARFDTRAVRLVTGTLVALSLVFAFGAGGAAARQSEAGAAQAQVVVYAAASLTDVFPKIDPTAKYSFAGSNTLAAQITQGAPADVFASANMTIPNQLNAKSLVSKPVVFTRNTTGFDEALRVQLIGDRHVAEAKTSAGVPCVICAARLSSPRTILRRRVDLREDVRQRRGP